MERRPRMYLLTYHYAEESVTLRCNSFTQAIWNIYDSNSRRSRNGLEPVRFNLRTEKAKV